MMPAEIIKIDPKRPEPAFARCREVIRAGGVIAYPTETFYGLGVDPKSPVAVRRLFEIKGRQPDQPILLLIQSTEDVTHWASHVTPTAEQLMKRFWPGPLTLVFPAREEVLPELTAGSGTIGLRMPGSELTRMLLGFLGAALTGTSANRSGGPSLRTAREVAAELGDLIDLVLDAGMTPGGKPSTVVDVTVDPPRVVREGAITIA
jgi:L-threonylcarbamoyladenylate synthase